MDTKLSVDLLSPGALSASEQKAWRAMASAPVYRSPFFQPEFALAADGVVPGAAVAVIHRAGAIAGFLPLQKRSGAVRPLSAPMCDYSGVIAAPGAGVELADVLRLIGAGSYAFGGLVAEAPPEGARCTAAAPMRADLSGGLEAYLAARPRTRRFFKDKVRRMRALAEEVGELEFQLEDSQEAFAFLLKHKREQYARTGRHDIFACGWTADLLRRLWEMRTADFGGRFTTLRAGGRLIAAEYGLHGAGVHHLWFPTYDPTLARFGPGTTMTIETVKAAAETPGLDVIDFGPGEPGDYKAVYADPGPPVYEGALTLVPLRRASSRMADAALSPAPALAEVRERLRRRFSVINACETTPVGWTAGAVTAFRHAARRHAPQPA